MTRPIQRQLTAEIRKAMRAKSGENAEGIELSGLALEIEGAKHAFGMNSAAFACIPSGALRLTVLGRAQDNASKWARLFTKQSRRIHGKVLNFDTMLAWFFCDQRKL